MNDILLECVGDGIFDWKFNGTNVENIIGDQQLMTSCIHNIFLNYNELELELYADKGSYISQYLKEMYHETTYNSIIDEIKKQCKKVDGVLDAEVQIKKTPYTLIIEKITLLKENGGTVEIAIQNGNTDSS
jgi:hypothetical protein